MKIPNNVTKRIGQIMNFMWKLEPNPVTKEQVEIEFKLLTSLEIIMKYLTSESPNRVVAILYR